MATQAPTSKTRRLFAVGTRYGAVLIPEQLPLQDKWADEPYPCYTCPNDIFEGTLCEECQSDAR